MERLNFFNFGQFRRQSSMHAHNLVLNQGTHRHTVETINKELPNLEVVPPFALIIEPIQLVDFCRLMIAPEQVNRPWELQHVRKQ